MFRAHHALFLVPLDGANFLAYTMPGGGALNECLSVSAHASLTCASWL
jgi:hypothetical protein